MEFMTGLFWDCECVDRFIHPHTQSECTRCGAYKEDQPHSIVSEVFKHAVGWKLDTSALLDLCVTDPIVIVRGGNAEKIYKEVTILDFDNEVCVYCGGPLMGYYDKVVRYCLECGVDWGKMDSNADIINAIGYIIMRRKG